MKSILTIILLFSIGMLSAQTATITLDVPYNWIGQEVQNERLEKPEGLMGDIRISYEPQNQQNHRVKGVGSYRSRTVEIQSETWAIREKSNLSLQVGKRDKGRKNAKSNDNVVHLDEMDFKIHTIQIYDVLGRILHSEIFELYDNRIPLDHLNDGIYYLVLRNEDNEPLYSQKLALK